MKTELYPDLYQTGGVCFIWFQMEPDDDYEPITELRPVTMGELRPGHWLPEEMYNAGLDLVFLGDFSYGKKWLGFALREGLYLYQPFLVAFDKPDWYQCNHPLDPEEWDVNYSWEIIYREGPTAEMVTETVRFLEQVLSS